MNTNSHYLDKRVDRDRDLRTEALSAKQRRVVSKEAGILTSLIARIARPYYD
jgi:hypothetical protein